MSSGETLPEAIQRIMHDNRDVLNRLEPHRGCVVCKGPLFNGECMRCVEVEPTTFDDFVRRVIETYRRLYLIYPWDGDWFGPAHFRMGIEWFPHTMVGYWEAWKVYLMAHEHGALLTVGVEERDESQ
jgi:predicted nucleic acid-binding Zn ribbon protein